MAHELPEPPDTYYMLVDLYTSKMFLEILLPESPLYQFHYERYFHLLQELEQFMDEINENDIIE